MSEPFSLLFDVTIHEGEWQNAKTTAANLVADVQKNEPNTLAYNCWIDEDSSRLCFQDTYASSEAFLEHFGRKTVGEALGHMMAISNVNGLTVMGNPNADARRALTELGGTFVTKLTGYERGPLATTP